MVWPGSLRRLPGLRGGAQTRHLGTAPRGRHLKPLRIVIALHQFPPHGSGGTEQLVRWTALALRKLGHTVVIIAATPRRARSGDGNGPGYVDPDELDVQFVPPGDAADGLADRITREYDDATAGAAFGHLVDVARPDVIHFFHLAGLTSSALRAAAARRIPVVLTVTDFWFECPTVQLLLDNEASCAGPQVDRMNCVRHLAGIRLPSLRAVSAWGVADRPAAAVLRFFSHLPGGGDVGLALVALQRRSAVVRKAFESVAALIAPNPNMHARLLAFGVAAQRLHLQPYGVPAAVTRGTADVEPQSSMRPRIAFVGTLTASKGAHLLLDAVVRSPVLAVDVDIYGQAHDGEYRTRLQRDANNDSRFTFRGTFDNRTFPTVLANVDLLVIPSLWQENSPLVLLQALAQRCPVLVADVPGLAPHVRVNVDGWTFARGDADDLAAKLRSILANPAGLRKVREASCEFRDTDADVDDLLRLYHRVLNAPSGAS